MPNPPAILKDSPLGADAALDSPANFNLKNRLIQQRWSPGVGLKTLYTPAGPLTNIADVLNDSGYMWTQNTSGANRLAGEILGISTPGVPTPQSSASDNRTINFFFNRNLVGVKPTTASNSGQFVVCCQPIPNNQWGWCRMTGDCQAYVNIQNTGDNYCDVTNNDSTQLTSGAIGSGWILYQNGSGTGKQLCWIRIGNSNLSGTIVVALTSDGTGSLGNDTSSSTWKYYMKDLNGNYFGAAGSGGGLSPKVGRVNGTYAAASWGQAYVDYSNNNTPTLLVAYELPGTTHC